MKPEPSTDPEIIYIKKKLLEESLKETIANYLTEASNWLTDPYIIENFDQKVGDAKARIALAEKLHKELNSL